MTETIKENKVIDTYSLHPATKSWVEQQAVALTAQEGRRVSKSEVVERIISEAKQKNLLMAALVLKKVRNGGKQIKQLKADQS